MVCSPLMPAAPEPPPDASCDRSLGSTSRDALASVPAGALASTGDAAGRSSSDGALTPVSAGHLASAPALEVIFYDGHCGFCHRAVRWVLKRDPAGTRFRFAPLQGPTFLKRVPAFYRATLPDTIVLQTSDGQATGPFRRVHPYPALSRRPLDAVGHRSELSPALHPRRRLRLRRSHSTPFIRPPHRHLPGPAARSARPLRRLTRITNLLERVDRRLERPEGDTQ